MSPPEDGGLASPAANLSASDSRPGMSLRDWFAGESINAARENVIAQGLSPHSDSIAVEAYELADAMLAERAKGGGV